MRIILVGLMLLLGACTSTRDFATPGYALPADKPVTILVMRPDVEVSSVTAGGVSEPNVEWTDAAKASLRGAIEAHQHARGNEVSFLPEQEGEAARLVADYENLHNAVAFSIAEFKYGIEDLPTKKDRFDWTLGPGVSRIGELGGGNYALFLYARDSFATSGRVAVQLIGALFGAYVPGGQRFAYASLVDLETGDIVWFNILSSATGDIRDPQGARETIDTLLESMPERTGE